MGTHHLATLPHLWRRWTEVVAWFAYREPGRLGLDPNEYDALHRALMRECQVQAEKAGADRAAWFRCLEQLVGPWLTTGSLEHADRELLADLLARCRIVDRELNGRDWLAPLRHHRWLAALVLACFMAPPVLVAVVDWGELPLAGPLRVGWRSFRVALREMGGPGFWFAASGLLVFLLLAIWALASPSRR